MKLEQHQVAVVTGAASGLGFALAEAFAARGLDLVLADVESARLGDAVGTVETKGVSAIGVPTDVRFSDQVDALVAATLDRFGRVDVVCNNAGVACMPRPMWEFAENDWEWVLSVNLHGVVHGIRAFVPHLVAQNSGHVVNTASMAGISVGPGLGPYLASKHAVVALTEALAVELAHAAPNVGVTVVCPGQVATNIVASERNRPAELAVEQQELRADVIGSSFAWMQTISAPYRMPPAEAAEIVLRAIESDTLHILPNGSSAGVRTWVDRLLADLPGN